MEEIPLATPPDTFDDPWKEALDTFFREFLEFFLPAAAAEVDWDRGFESLENELRQLIPASEIGLRRVDKLVKLWLRDGSETWVLIHIEIQSQEEGDFPQRLAIYQFRLRSRYDRPIALLVVLGDDRPNWRPDRYESQFWGTALTLTYPVVKLLD